MAKQTEEALCDIYIMPDERRLLAKIAHGRGIGRDYIALRAAAAPVRAVRGRPIPHWLGPQKPAPQAPLLHRPRATPQARHCRSCAHLCRALQANAGRAYICAAGVWTRPLQEQSLKASCRLRKLSLTCAHYQTMARPERAAPHHCRACRELAAADTIDERFVCGRGVWINPMKPQSVANGRRIARLSAACALFVPNSSRWIPRSKRRGLRDKGT